MEATSRGLVGLLVPAKGEQIHARDGGASAVVAQQRAEDAAAEDPAEMRG